MLAWSALLLFLIAFTTAAFADAVGRSVAAPTIVGVDIRVAVKTTSSDSPVIDVTRVVVETPTGDAGAVVGTGVTMFGEFWAKTNRLPRAVTSRAKAAAVVESLDKR